MLFSKTAFTLSTILFLGMGYILPQDWEARRRLVVIEGQAPPETPDVWVDGALTSDCTSSNYDSTSRDCTGVDGDAYDTVAEAVSNASANDTIGIRGSGGGFDGIYETSTYITVNKNLTLAAYSNETPSVHGTQDPNVSEHWETFWVSGSADVTFTGLEIYGTRNAFDEDFGHEAIGCWTSGRVTIDNCEIHDYNHCGIKGSSKLTLIDSHIYDIGTLGDIYNDHAIYWTRNGSLNDVVIERNQFDGITGAALHLYNAGSTCGYFIARYNTVIGGSVNGDTTWGVLLSCSNCLIYNNSFYDVDIPMQFFRSACDYNTVSNNAMYGSRTSDLSIDTAGGGDPCGTNNSTANNYLGSATACDSCTGDYADLDDAPPNIRDTNNPFVSTPDTWDDFRLASGSGAINAGDSTLGDDHKWGFSPNDLIWPPTILNQDSYGSGWEIGVFIYIP